MTSTAVPTVHLQQESQDCQGSRIWTIRLCYVLSVAQLFPVDIEAIKNSLNGGERNCNESM